MNGKAQAYRKKAFQNKYKEEHWSPVKEGQRKQMLSQENYCLLERDIQILVCQELGFFVTEAFGKFAKTTSASQLCY